LEGWPLSTESTLMPPPALADTSLMVNEPAAAERTPPAADFSRPIPRGVIALRPERAAFQISQCPPGDFCSLQPVPSRVFFEGTWLPENSAPTDPRHGPREQFDALVDVLRSDDR